MDNEAVLRHIQRDDTIAFAPGSVEKIYLTRQTNVKSDLRQTFGNSIPWYVRPNGHEIVSLRKEDDANFTCGAPLGLIMAFIPSLCDVVEWRGAGGDDDASTLVLLCSGRLPRLIFSFT